MGKRGKISETLARALEAAQPDGWVELVVSLPHPAAVDGASRQEQIAARQSRFGEAAREVEARVAALGGEVLARAWVNSTLKVRVPAGCVNELREAAGVVALDVVGSLTRG